MRDLDIHIGRERMDSFVNGAVIIGYFLRNKKEG